MKQLPDKLLKALPAMCRASIDVVDCTLRAGGAAVTPAARDELLAKLAAGEYVELELDITAYEQKAGEQNHNYVRFRDGAMVALGRSGAGKPFLRDHNQRDSMSVAGTIVSSTTEKRGEGDYVIRQTVRLTATWAVELALRGLLKFVSIGWRATGPVMCSACEEPVFSECWHYPGQQLKDDNGDPTGERVEWIYTAGELIETSSVPVPGVASAQIDDIRAALAAHEGFAGEGFPEESSDMKDFPKLLALLGLAATAGEPEIISAVEKLKADSAELGLAKKELEIASKELSVLAAEKKKSAEDKFIFDALASGRIGKAQESEWREFYQLSSDRASKRMAEKPEGSVTPVGLDRQSAKDPAPADKPATKTDTVLQENGIKPALATQLAKVFGCTEPEKFISASIGANGEA